MLLGLNMQAIACGSETKYLHKLLNGYSMNQLVHGGGSPQRADDGTCLGILVLVVFQLLIEVSCTCSVLHCRVQAVLHKMVNLHMRCVAERKNTCGALNCVAAIIMMTASPA